jgi:SSS family solute:Na+ symporter
LNFLHFAVLLFAVCSVLLVLVSLATAPEPDSKLRGLTRGGEGAVRREAGPGGAITGVLSLGVVLAVAAVWISFRG